jgi:hypothetical protein
MSSNEKAVPPVPRRPLTAYNIFSILERNYIVQQSEETSPGAATGGKGDAGLDPYLSRRPQRYRDIVLPSNWYVVGMNRKKRAEHKNHGLISFKGLSKTVSDSWKKVDHEVVAFCTMVAAEQLESYRKAQDDFKKKYGEKAFNAQKKTYKKRAKADSPDAKSSKADIKELCEVTQEYETNVKANRSVENHSYQRDAVAERIVGHTATISQSQINLPMALGSNENQHGFQAANLFTMNKFNGAIYNGSMQFENYLDNGTVPLSIGCIGPTSHSGVSLSEHFSNAQNESKPNHEMIQRRGSDTSIKTDFSLDEYIAPGSIAVRAFDTDNDLASSNFRSITNNIPAIYNGSMLFENYLDNGTLSPSFSSYSHSGASLCAHFLNAQSESKPSHETMQRRGSDTSIKTEFSLDEYIASGSIAVQAFDTDSDLASYSESLHTN